MKERHLRGPPCYVTEVGSWDLNPPGVLLITTLGPFDYLCSAVVLQQAIYYSHHRLLPRVWNSICFSQKSITTSAPTYKAYSDSQNYTFHIFRSFEPILRLVPKFEAPESQHWSIWALCNLTTMYRKYTTLTVHLHTVFQNVEGFELIDCSVENYIGLNMLHVGEGGLQKSVPPQPIPF